MKEDMKEKIASARQHANDILAICGALEACQALEQTKQAVIKKRGPKPKGMFDRATYQREYMREYMRRRAAQARKPKESPQ